MMITAKPRNPDFWIDVVVEGRPNLNRKILWPGSFRKRLEKKGFDFSHPVRGVVMSSPFQWLPDSPDMTVLPHFWCRTATLGSNFSVGVCCPMPGSGLRPSVSEVKGGSS